MHAGVIRTWQCGHGALVPNCCYTSRRAWDERRTGLSRDLRTQCSQEKTCSASFAVVGLRNVTALRWGATRHDQRCDGGCAA